MSQDLVRERRRVSIGVATHAEQAQTALAAVVHENNDLRAENGRMAAAIERVRELADELASAPTVGSSSEAQWEFDTQRECAKGIRAALGGDR